MNEPLARIRFVLVETTHSGNIGAVARAMKTMGLSRLELVAPRQRPDAEALARASGADDLLERAGIHQTLTEALVGCRLVIGTSARLRSIEWPLLEPPECAARLLAEAQEGEVALVLGRESSGLTNDELARCHFLAHIPTNPAFSSLNLAAAAQVFAYEIRRAARVVTGERLTETPRDLASAEAMEGFYTHLADTLIQIGFSDPEQSRTLIRRLRRLFNRARPDRVELNILRGILSAAQGRKTPNRFARPDDSAP
ncbi:RNA methyltransferase [Thermochromatium tepidum]|nr:RNA methyltransferase [Thermochromatium tepidum]